MILEQFTKIINKAIYHYKDAFGIDEISTQIQIRIIEGKLVFKIANKWQPEIDVTFKQILLKPIDIFNYESLSTPYFKKSLQDFALECNVNEEEVSAFFCLHPETKIIHVAFYEKGVFKKIHKLSEELNRLGI